MDVKKPTLSPKKTHPCKGQVLGHSGMRNTHDGNEGKCVGEEIELKIRRQDDREGCACDVDVREKDYLYVCAFFSLGKYK